MENWNTLSEFLFEIHNLEIIKMDENWNIKVDLVIDNVLSDQRVLNLLSCITDLKPQDIKHIFSLRRFRIHTVDINASIKGWVTPIGVVINIPMLSDLEITNILAFSRILGHEMTHFLSRVSSRNFSQSTPERAVQSHSFKNLISRLEVDHPDLQNHLESGLIFELGFIGAKFSSLDRPLQRIQWSQLENLFSNPKHSLPIFKKGKYISACPTIQFNNQFGFFPTDPEPILM
jgi:hypothetical protein